MTDYVRKYQERLKSEGKCVRCRRLRDSRSSWFCGECIIKHRVYQLKRYHEKKGAKDVTKKTD